MAQIPLPISSYRFGQAPTASASRLVNCFAEQAPQPGGKSPILLRRAPGIADLPVSVEFEGGPYPLSFFGDEIRGMGIMGASLYVLVGDSLIRVEDNWTGFPVGFETIPGSERVKMETNGTDLVIVRPGAHTAYACDGTSTAQITDSVFTGFGGASDVGFLDGYLIFLIPDSQRFFNSGINALTFNALDVATAEAAPDNLVGLLVNRREIFLPGTQTGEIWYDAANPVGSPFSRSPNGFITYGLAAADGMGIQESAIFFLSNQKTVQVLSGDVPQKVSQFGIDSVLQSMSVIDDCYCLPYNMEGHSFLAFTFPFEGRTLVFDATVGEWHERESLGYGAWRPSCIVNFAGKQIVGDSRSGSIGYLDQNTFEEFGEPQKCSWQYQPIYAERNRISLRRLELAFNPGHGTTTGQGSNPLATLFKSKDGGETFTAMPMKSLGQRGKYQTRAVWWNMGTSRDFVLRMEVTDPVPLFATDTVIEAQGARF